MEKRLVIIGVLLAFIVVLVGVLGSTYSVCMADNKTLVTSYNYTRCNNGTCVNISFADYENCTFGCTGNVCKESLIGGNPGLTMVIAFILGLGLLFLALKSLGRINAP